MAKILFLMTGVVPPVDPARLAAHADGGPEGAGQNPASSGPARRRAAARSSADSPVSLKGLRT